MATKPRASAAKKAAIAASLGEDWVAEAKATLRVLLAEARKRAPDMTTMEIIGFSRVLAEQVNDRDGIIEDDSAEG